MDMSLTGGRHGNKVSSGPIETLHPPPDTLDKADTQMGLEAEHNVDVC